MLAQEDLTRKEQEKEQEHSDPETNTDLSNRAARKAPKMDQLIPGGNYKDKTPEKSFTSEEL